jgi:hypothetical protein
MVNRKWLFEHGEFKFQAPNSKSQIPKTEKRINEMLSFNPE